MSSFVNLNYIQGIELEEQYEKFEPHKVINYLQYYKHLMAVSPAQSGGVGEGALRRVEAGLRRG